MTESEWFSTWFDSPYYHLLYFHHDDSDARAFIDSLISHIQLKRSDHILDLACGRGRHAIYLNTRGFNVTGLDLSPKNIALAKRFENPNLHFATHDMRDPIPGVFDLVLNLFTSFGYFPNDMEHLKALRNVSDALKPKGTFVLDYMNSEWVKNHLVHRNEVEIEGVHFHLERRLSGEYIEKDIRFNAGEESYFFQERVRSFSMQELEELIEMAGMRIERTWGDYELGPFIPERSARMIFYCTKA